MSRKVIKTSKALNRILRCTLGRYLIRRYGIEFNGKGIEGLKPPYLILINHTNFWDPFLLSACIPEPIHYVASDQYFRNPILRSLLKLTGAIPKTKFFSDMDTVKHILAVKKNGGIIGIFPEGARNWDGRTMELIYSTAKLVKNLKIPVVTVVMKGAYLSLPRWAGKSRKGKVIIYTKRTLNPDEIKGLTVEEIHNAIKKDLDYDEAAWQRDNMIAFKGRNLAERLELLLFTCPHCKSMDTLKSQGNLFACRSCGYSVEMDEYGFFHTKKQKLYFDNPAEWNAWQIEYLKAMLAEYCQDDRQDSFMEEKRVLLWKGGRRSTPLRKFRIGNVSLFKDRMVFTSILGETIVFPVERLQGVNVHYNNKIELYYENVLYRFVFKGRIVSAYKWVKALKMLGWIKSDKAGGQRPA